MKPVLVRLLCLFILLAPVLNAQANCCAPAKAATSNAEKSPCGHEMAADDNSALSDPAMDCGQGLDCCGMSTAMLAVLPLWDFSPLANPPLSSALPAVASVIQHGLLRPPRLS